MNNEYIIALFLAKKRESFTLHELSKQVNIPYSSLYRTVKKMKDITQIEIKGKSKLIEIIWNEITTATLTIASYKEQKKFLKKHHLIKRIAEQTKDITLIFGSYAKGTQTKKSDIDIIIINEKGERTTSFSNLELLYETEINPMFFTKEEFTLMIQDKEENVGKQALKDHILLSGFEEFWRLIKNAI